MAEIGAAPDAGLVARLHADKTRRYGAGVAGLRLRPGIARIIAEAVAEGCRLAIATTTTTANVEALCRACLGRGMAQVFDVVAAGDMVAAKKPAPDVYLLALERLGVAPEEALAFEDSRNGLVSARAAGIPVVLVQAMFTEGEPTDGAALVLPGYDAVAGLSGLRAALARGCGGGMDGAGAEREGARAATLGMGAEATRGAKAGPRSADPEHADGLRTPARAAGGTVPGTRTPQPRGTDCPITEAPCG